MNGLAAALDLYFAEGPERVWARHALTARACRAGVEALGLALWPASAAVASPTATAVGAPPGFDEAAMRARARALYGVVLSGGRAATAGRLTRIGHMGPGAHPIHAVAAAAALGGALCGPSATPRTSGPAPPRRWPRLRLTNEPSIHGGRSCVQASVPPARGTRPRGPLAYDFEDSQSAPRPAVAVAQRFANDPRIVAELGDLSSTASMAASPIYQR